MVRILFSVLIWYTNTCRSYFKMTDYLVDGEATYNYAYLYHLINERVDMKEKISNYKKFEKFENDEI